MVVEQYGVAERILDVHSQGILWVQDVVATVQAHLVGWTI